jgi:prepilin-type processing-associated H-X9-DG protein
MYKTYPLGSMRKQFSIIEMMTVVFIILLLMSLMMPTFVNIKMNARASLCKGQMRQIGAMITSYTTEYGGYLPNDDYYNRTTAPYPIVYNDLGRNVNNSNMYAYWNGHLLPFLDSFATLTSGFYRYAAVTKHGTTRYSSSQWGSGVPNGAPPDVLKNNWIVIEDAYRKGGYQDFKVFICPEIHTNTFDVGVAKNYNDLRIPRISQLCGSGFEDKAGYDYSATGGTPTTYCANSLFFGKNGYYDAKVDSYRIDQLEDPSEKAFMVEGGLVQSYFASDPYYYPTNNYYVSNSGGLIPNFDKGPGSDGDSNQKLSFVHDPNNEFWIKGGKTSFRWANASYGSYRELANKFNTQFAGKAMMIAGSGDSSGWAMSNTLVSFIDPEDGKIFKDFFSANSTLSPTGGWVQFVGGEELDYNYLVGKMNVLFGDGSVSLKDNAWLCNNRMRIGMAKY